MSEKRPKSDGHILQIGGFVKLGPEDVGEPDVDVVERFRQMLEDEQRTKLGGEENNVSGRVEKTDWYAAGELG